MSAPETAVSLGTKSDDYSTAYYGHYVEGVAEYDWDTDHWRNFFLNVADRVVGLTGPTRTLDVGCAKGLLVQALMTRGVDAYGYDISEDAIATASPEVRDRLRVASATEPIEGRYDLITCTEVLEHMSPSDAQRAIDAICAATDLVLFSSCPTDYAESTHVNSNPTAQWAAWFAERGFYRRLDADVVFLAPWAILFERADPTLRTVVERYESGLEPLRNEVIAKRQALLEVQRRLTQASGQGTPGIPGREVELDDEELLERHASLIARDHVAGLEAQVVRLERELSASRERRRQLRNRIEDLEEELGSLRESRTMKVGRAVTAPARRLRG